MPPLTDFLALLGLDLVLCAGCLRLLSRWQGAGRWAKWITAFCFVVLWLPVGAVQLPVLAFIRGVSSDLSITLVALACLGLCQRLFGLAAPAEREKTVLTAVLAAAALVLYPSALGWSNWDAYRIGWASYGFWASLLVLSLFCWSQGLRLVPLLAGLALLAWSASLMESANLWDYLIDPWLAVAALFQCLRSGVRRLWKKFRRLGTKLPLVASSS